MKKLLSLSLAGAVTGLMLSVPVFAQNNSTAEQVSKGQYLAVAGDCGACHTAPGGQAFAGGLALDTPLGKIYSTNITASKVAGVGNYTLEDFEKAVRQGIRKDGANLYPAMPYTAYSNITDTDMQALYAYFMQSVKPVDEKGPATDLPFPFNIRMSMAAWNLLFAGGKPYAADNSKPDEWNRGAYLVEGLTHCSTCHTPRNALMAEESDKALAGASLGTWFAPNITPDPHAGIGNWSENDFKQYLATGHSANGSQAGGPMLEAINKSFSKLSPEDIAAVTTYIRSVPAQNINAAPGKLPISVPKLSDVDIMNGSASQGTNLYEAYCSTCHQLSGQGSNGLPALYGNAALRRPVADNTVMAILDGLTPDKGQAMPSFSNKMNDEQVATLVNYVFKTFGDAKVQTTPERVKILRQGGEASPLLAIAKGGIIVGAIIVILLVIGVAIILNRRKRG